MQMQAAERSEAATKEECQCEVLTALLLRKDSYANRRVRRRAVECAAVQMHGVIASKHNVFCSAALCNAACSIAKSDFTVQVKTLQNKLSGLRFEFESMLQATLTKLDKKLELEVAQEASTDL